MNVNTHKQTAERTNSKFKLPLNVIKVKGVRIQYTKKMPSHNTRSSECMFFSAFRLIRLFLILD